MSYIIMSELLYRCLGPVIEEQFVFSQTRQGDLWENVSTLSENLQKIAESDNEHNHKKELAKDQLLALKKVFQELGLW